uniref:Retrovirus-related Pol polyprotein from transposon TNT 1-94 n=1 Tax=Tanacetum cinerariifolium TaxID=118510 RepID=A0A6L2L0X5_TANCI|nr:hypothetical protein [Tanacetum cinerariifolium]
MTSQFQQNPGDTKRELKVSCYTDVGYLTDADDLKSHTGYEFVTDIALKDKNKAKMDKIKHGNGMSVKKPKPKAYTSLMSQPVPILSGRPDDSLIMGNKELSTILEKESDEVIKFSVEDLVPIPSEFEDTSGIHHDPSIPVMSVASILEGFIDEPPLEEYDDLFNLESKENNEWKKSLYDAPIDDLMTEDKIFDPGIHEKSFSPTYVSLPFTNSPYLFFTYVVRILLLYFTYPVVSPFLISSGSENTIFDLGIFAFHFSHRSGTFISFNVYPNILNESPMEICSSTRFNPNMTMIWGVFDRTSVFVLNGGVVDWKSTKQSIFATSSTDVEYIAAFDASKEAVWIRSFIYWFGVVPTIKEPINMYCDNTVCIEKAKDHGVTKGARHFRGKVHYLRETIEMGDVRIEKVDTYDNLADPFTKALAFPKHLN